MSMTPQDALQNLAQRAAAWWCDAAMSDGHDAGDLLALGMSAGPTSLIARLRDSWRRSPLPLDAFRADLEATVLAMLTQQQSLSPERRQVMLWTEYDAQYDLREVCKRTGMTDALFPHKTKMRIYTDPPMITVNSVSVFTQE